MKKLEGYHKGIDFGGWFSQCDYSKDRFDNFITEKDFEIAAGWGIDHIRLPFDYNLLETESGEYIEEGFERLEKALAAAKKNGLRVVLDLHKTFGYSFDAGEKQEGFFDKEDYQERFYRLWEQMAKRFGSRTDDLCFELLNEVTDEAYSDTWNKIATTCISRIRAIAPDVLILIGGYWNNSPDALKDLIAPPDDKVAYNFHCYDPIIFTHQGAYWISTMPSDLRISLDAGYDEYVKKTALAADFGLPCLAPLQYGSGKVDAEYFINRFRMAVEVAEKNNAALYCGEYGVIDLADPNESLKWFKAINEAFEHYGISRAAWTYRKMDFGFTDEHFASVLNEVVKYL